MDENMSLYKPRIRLKKISLLIMVYLILLLVAPVTFAVFALVLPPQYEETFLGELKYKYDALRQTSGKRIIVIGGSSVAFGQYSDLMEGELSDYTVINFGMYASLGSVIMLDLARSYIREGDIIIFSPEQNPQTLSMYFNSEAMWQAADSSYNMLFNLPKERLGTMVGQFVYYASKKFNYYKSGEEPGTDGFYMRKSFNEYGDIINTGRDQNVMSGGFDPNTLIRFDVNIISEDFISYLNTYAKSCNDNGASFYYRFCPMNALAVEVESSNEISSYYNYLQKKLDFEIIGSPYTSIMDAEWFYDTNFHLNSAGAIVNTRAMIQDIKHLLNDTSSTDIRMPQKPSIQFTIVTEGDNSNENCFLYEENNGELRLVGLTKEGQLKDRLILPTEHKGYPVTTFAPFLFAGNKVIKEIIIQSNITRIENLSFDGCKNLERLILTNSRPENCSVSEDLLSGTNGNVYVSGESLFAYQTNYFWSQHSSRIFPDPNNTNSIYTSEGDNAKVVEENLPDSSEFITYNANGGRSKNSDGYTVDLPMTTGHIRTNTALGTQLFEREGYVLKGWNTKEDGSGEYIGFGSRIDRKIDLILYAQWEKVDNFNHFEYYIKDSEIRITKYLGNSKICVIPEEIDGQPVTRICSNAFEGAKIDTIMIPPTVFAVERQAFSGSTVREIYLYDSLYYIYDESFENCNNLSVLHINAATPPVYSGSYFDTFSDKFDWLLSIKDKKKMVLFSGSSARFGYDSPAINKAFPDYQIANMGVYAYTNALPQLMIIKTVMKEGDILLSAPEFDTIKNQFATTNALDSHFFAMMESNYDAIALLDLRDYTKVFESLCTYLTSRSNMGGKNYSISPRNYDDEGKRYEYETYNQYGDFVLKRPNGQHDELLQTYLADYTISAFPPETIQSINSVYKKFLDYGIKVYFSYAPRNRSSITTDSTLSARKELHEYLMDNLCVPIISDIEDYLYSGIYFYLIDNHLSDQGVRMRTEQIIKDISNQFAHEEETTSVNEVSDNETSIN